MYKDRVLKRLEEYAKEVYEDFKDLKAPLLFSAGGVIADKYTTWLALKTYSLDGEKNIFLRYIVENIGVNGGLTVSALAAIPGIYLIGKAIPVFEKLTHRKKLVTKTEQSRLQRDMHYGLGMVEYLLAANNYGLTNAIGKSYGIANDFINAHPAISSYSGISSEHLSYILGIGLPLILLWLMPTTFSYLRDASNWEKIIGKTKSVNEKLVQFTGLDKLLKRL